jgi:hypothetical protein
VKAAELAGTEIQAMYEQPNAIKALAVLAAIRVDKQGQKIVTPAALANWNGIGVEPPQSEGANPAATPAGKIDGSAVHGTISPKGVQSVPFSVASGGEQFQQEGVQHREDASNSTAGCRVNLERGAK